MTHTIFPVEYQSLLQAVGLLRPVPVEEVNWAEFRERAVQVDVLRADLLHPVISGNKWFKLKNILAYGLQNSVDSFISIGGAWSNHLHALAYCGHLLGFKTQAYVRGEELSPRANAMLAEAHDWGMALEFVPRKAYRSLCQSLAERMLLIEDRALAIPEGGACAMGAAGVLSMLQQPDLKLDQYPFVLTPVGTGCTFAGIRLALPAKSEVIGISALKGNWLVAEMRQMLDQYAKAIYGLESAPAIGPWSIIDEFCNGGFAKTSPKLLAFMAAFSESSGVPVEPIYSGKVFYGLSQLVQQGRIPEGSKVLVIHGGGLQGLRGFQD